MCAIIDWFSKNTLSSWSKAEDVFRAEETMFWLDKWVLKMFWGITSWVPEKELFYLTVLPYFLRPESVSNTKLLLPVIDKFPKLIITPSLGVSAGFWCKRRREWVELVLLPPFYLRSPDREVID